MVGYLYWHRSLRQQPVQYRRGRYLDPKVYLPTARLNYSLRSYGPTEAKHAHQEKLIITLWLVLEYKVIL